MPAPITLYTTRSGTDANAPATDGVAVSSTSTFYSDEWGCHDAEGISLTVFFSGTPTGTFTLWYTDKPFPNQANDNDWIQDSTFSPTNPAGAAGKFGVPSLAARSFKHRLKYVNSSGSGVINAYATTPKQR